MPSYDTRYGPDVLGSSRRRGPTQSTEVAVEPGMVVEDVQSGFCGAVVDWDNHGLTLEDRHGRPRGFPWGAGFHLEGRPVRLTHPVRGAPPSAPGRTASGSVAVRGHRARVARESRIYVEGRHDAALVEQVWGADLRVEGVVVEELGGADDLPAVVTEFSPDPGRRLGILLDHLVDGSKESRIAASVQPWIDQGDVLVLGHPYVDIWQAVRPGVLGLQRWPQIPRGTDWKAGMVAALGWDVDVPTAWRRILGRVTTYADLEPALLGRVEELIDFVTVSDA